MRAEDAFRYNLKRKLNERGIKPKMLASKADVSLSCIYDTCEGKSTPTVINAWRIANGLGITIDELFKNATFL